MLHPLIKLSVAKLFVLFILAFLARHAHAGLAEGESTASMYSSALNFSETGVETSPQFPEPVDADSAAPVSGTSSPLKNAAAIDDWLKKMMRSMKQQNFQGTLIIRQANKIQAVKVKRGVTLQGNWQILESLTGESQKIIRRNDKVTTIFPGKRLVIISDSVNKRPLHAILPENYHKLMKHYEMKLSGEDRIANKVTQIIQMVPRDKYRYGYTFWLDKQSGMLLKCDLMNENNQVLEQLMYSDIELLLRAPQTNIDQRLLATYKQVNLQDKSETVSKIWRASQLPVGFGLSRSVYIPPQHNHAKTFHMVFSDGMASVSVFIEERDKMKKPVLGQSSMGKVNAYSAYVNDAYITAIGEVPVSTVRMIALSMQPAK